SAGSRTFGFVKKHEPQDATQVQNTLPTVEWLAANRQRLRGSWERSRLKRNRQIRSFGPSRASKLRRGFCFPERVYSSFARRKPDRETRIPGVAGARARPKRGACRRERGEGRTPMAERTRGSLRRRAIESAATEFVFDLRQVAAQAVCWW